MPYLGNTPTTQGFVPAVDYFSGNGSTTAFTLSRSVASVAQIEAVIENVPQNPSDAFTVSGNTLTFTSAPPSGSNNIYVRYTSPITQVMQPSDNSVGQRQLTSDLQNATYGMKNRIINGAMMIDQRNAGAAVSNISGYTLDRWQGGYLGSGTGRFSAQQSSTAPTGFKNSVVLTVTTADASPSAAYAYYFSQAIEGYNVADMGFGAVGAATFTISFWVRSSLTGTFPVVVDNYGSTRSYGSTYTINSANTWEQKFITIAGDTSGTWAKDNGGGLSLIFGLGGGSSRTLSPNTWTTGSGATQTNVTGCSSIIGTSGATFYITGVQLEKGSTATSFDYRPYGTELALCQRYYETQYFRAAAYGNGSATIIVAVPMKVSKRATPTITLGSDPESWTSNFPTAAGNAYNADSIGIYTATVVASAGLARLGSILSISAEL